MRDLLKLIWWGVSGFFRSRSSLEAEILTLRHQLNVLQRKAPKRPVFSNFDRLVFASLYRLAPGIVNALVIVRPETVIGWHRAGFRWFWRWKSRSRGGRPKLPRDIRQLILEMSLANPLWGAPRIHGELLKLGINWVKPRSRSIWQDAGDPHRKGGRLFCAIMPRASPRWISLWFQRFPFGYFMAC
jgi:hypothetical protein